jgi:hypothetical protein
MKILMWKSCKFCERWYNFGNYKTRFHWSDVALLNWSGPSPFRLRLWVCTLVQSNCHVRLDRTEPYASPGLFGLLESLILVTAETCITCPIPPRLWLPCPHFMLPAAHTGTPIALSLLHPGWWLDGPAVVPATWKMEFIPPGLSQMSLSESTEITWPLDMIPPSAS